jgi:adenine-specific DNA methylase
MLAAPILRSMQTFRAKAAVSADKVRGGYYTPQTVARFLARWVAVAGGKILEPSCGDGNILRELAAVADRAQGVELVAEEADKARVFAQVETSNLFDWLTDADYGQWDGVVGNPPYIRFGNWADEQRAPALSLMSSVGLRPSKLTNAWVPFVVASALAARDGGRVGLVIPAELMQVTYAAQLREYLLRTFAEITLVTFKRLLFDSILQEVVLFLGVKGEGPAQMRTVHLADASSLDGVNLDVPSAPALLHDHEKWTKYFLAPVHIDVLRRLKAADDLTPLGELADVDVGVVTGRNSFFTLSEEQVRAYGLCKYVEPLVSRGAQLSGIVYDADCRSRDLDGNLRTWILNAPDDLTKEPVLAAYVRAGEAAKVHMGYKCSIRKPWWKTPSMWVPDAFMLRQIHLAPRMTANAAGATTTDTVHRVRVRDGLDPLALSVAFHNSTTFAFAEVMGRSYGGGILELEPREAELLPVPSPAHVTPGLIADVDMLLKSGETEKVLDLVDRQVLVDGLGWEPSLVAACREAWISLRDRRAHRGH